MAVATLDTNVAVHALGDGPHQRAGLLALSRSSFASVQLLNEYTVVARRKVRKTWLEIADDIATIRDVLDRIDPLTEAAHEEARRIAERYQLAFFDSLMLAVALSGGAGIFYSEDMQHGLVVDDRLRIVNPFLPDFA